MSEIYEAQLEIAKTFFVEGLPYWCDIFGRPAAEEFTKYLGENGYKVHNLTFEIFETVYIPENCNYKAVKATAKKRKELREQGIDEDELPILL